MQTQICFKGMNMNFKTIGTMILGVVVSYLGFVQDIVFFRIIFDIMFAVSSFASFILFVIMILVPLKGNDTFKIKCTESLDKFKIGSFTFIFSLLVAGCNFYCINQMFPTFASWYLLTVILMWISILNIKRIAKSN
jgi:hypothetical protein